jgi:ABC-type nitrate/sulfonate/bicarbonate transport system substrate-binding protein
MTPEDVQFLPLQPPQQLAAIINHNVDGAWMWEPFINPAVKDGARWIVKDADVGSTTSFGMAANSSWAKDNTEALGRLLRAFDQGQRKFASDREPTLKEIKTNTGIERDLAIRLIDGSVWYNLADQTDPKSPVSMADPTNLQQGLGKQLKEIEEIALWGKVIAKPGSIPGFLNNRPAKFALGK